YGGFLGNETTRNERDWTTHETILSGDIGAPGDATDNVYHVVNGSSTLASAVLDGVTISGGAATGTFPKNRGGGIRMVGGNATIRNVTISGNIARDDGQRAGFGAGIFNDVGSSPTLVNVRFIDNHAEGSAGGGGMANKNNSHPTLMDVTFEGNSAGLLGGGMTNDTGSSPTLVNVVFRGNSAEYTGGMDNYQNADPVLWNVTFENNTATEYGGGMTNDENSDPKLYNVIFAGNVAENATKPGGGGLQNNASNPLLVGVTFAGNRAANGADGMFSNAESAPVVRNAIFWGNGIEIVGPVDLSHAIVQGGFEGTAVLDADPLFVQMPTTEVGGDLHLQATSPALNAGDAAALPEDAQDLDADEDRSEPLPVDRGGAARIHNGAIDLGAYEEVTPVSNEESPGSLGFHLDPPFPNPVEDSTTLRYRLDRPGYVQLRVFDVRGREVGILVDASQSLGEHHATFHTTGLSSGLYFARLRTAAGFATHPFVLLP
ncbi:MAG TPA: T9SS type A sorting domain-containing protein, partial [Rhodothermales bacterium]|nr:T9SS type A sorting domain-containing protein [Rhodothermales bacterium]